MPKHKGKCIFCGKVGKLTGEHLWPAWLQRRLTPTARAADRPHRSGSTFAGSQPETWDAPPFTLKVPQVCKDCNTGWMSTLEFETAPILTPMLAGRKVELDAAAQATLARWLVKTAMVYQETTPHEAIKPHQYRYLAMHLRPPPSSQVWIAGRSKQEPQPALFTIRTVELRPGSEVGVSGGRRHDAYLVTIAIFQFVGQVLGHDLPFDSPWTRRGVFAPTLQEIWPVGGPLSWPPPDLLDADLRAFAEDPDFEAHLTRIFASRGADLRPGQPR